jgi:hypothetical protein
VLDCVSKLNYFLSKGAGVKQDFEVFHDGSDEARPKRNNERS